MCDDGAWHLGDTSHIDRVDVSGYGDCVDGAGVGAGDGAHGPRGSGCS